MLEQYIYQNYNQNWYDDNGILLPSDAEMMLEAADLSKSYIIRDQLYPKVATVLKTPVGDRRFKMTVGKFVDKNADKLHTSGPQYMIPFADIDKGMFYKVFDITEKEINEITKQVITILRGQSGTADFKLLSNNPIFWLFYCVIRYYSTETKDTRGLNTALIIYALSVYPSIFSKYFQHAVSDVGAMQYTVDHLTEKFILKKTGHVFGMLTTSIQNSYNFLKESIGDGSDKEVVRFIQRIRNDQNSLIKKICDNYMKNHAAGNTVVTVKDQFDDVPAFDADDNNTTIINRITMSTVIPMIQNGVDLKRAEVCGKMTKISLSDIRYYISKILVPSEEKYIVRFVQAILFLFLYTDQKKEVDINSSYFLVWAAECFRRTNANDVNVVTIKQNLDRWAENTGVYERYRREASRVAYKKAIFFYFILMIQAYHLK